MPLPNSAIVESSNGCAVDVLGLRQPLEEIGELLEGEGVVLGEFFHRHGIAAVVAEVVARLRDADFGDGNRVPFTCPC
jgi:hypothetical protein